MTVVRITVADVEVELNVSGAKVDTLAAIARAEIDHALDRADSGRLIPRPLPASEIGFRAELAEDDEP